MADNITVTSGTGVTIAADDDGSALHQWVKIQIGGNGSFVPVTTANGLPVQVLSLPPFPLVQVSGTSIAITSLPDLGLNSVVKITSLPDLGLNSAVKITSLPDLGLNSVVKITSLPDLGLNSFVKISSLPGVVIISATNAVPVNIVAGGAGNGSILDGANTAIKASVLSFTNASPLAVRLTDTNGDYVAPGAASYITISNLASVPITVSGTTIAITSLPDLGLNSVVKITSLPDLGLNSVVKITSLPDLGLNSSVKITSLPDLGAASIVKIQIGGAGSFVPITTANGLPVQILSMPSLGIGGIVSISNGTIVSVTNLVPVVLSSSAYRFVVNQTAPISGYFRFTSTYTSAQTNAVLVALPASTSALHITDCIFSNAQTHGSFTILESPSNGAVRPILDRLYFRDYGGAVLNLVRPLVLDTNSALIFTSRTATDHSVTVVGYVR